MELLLRGHLSLKLRLLRRSGALELRLHLLSCRDNEDPLIEGHGLELLLAVELLGSVVANWWLLRRRGHDRLQTR
jgi:hypothetical protein